MVDAVLRQRIGQSSPPSSSRRTLSGPLGCSHHCTPCWQRRRPAGAPASAVAQRLQVAQHQPPPRCPDAWPSSLDLRQASRAASIAITSARSGSSSALTGGGSTWHSRMSAMIARLALVEAHQHRALLGHMPRRQARPIAVAPGGALRSAAAPARACTLARCQQVVLQRALLDRHLRRRHAGAASCSHRRPRRAGRKCGQAGRTRCALSRAIAVKLACSQLVLAPVHLHPHTLTRQGAFDEDPPCPRRCAPRPAPRGRATRPPAIRPLPSWARIIPDPALRGARPRGTRANAARRSRQAGQAFRARTQARVRARPR